MVDQVLRGARGPRFFAPRPPEPLRVDWTEREARLEAQRREEARHIDEMLEGVEAEPLPPPPPEPAPEPPRWLQWEEIDARRRVEEILARPTTGQVPRHQLNRDPFDNF